MYTHHDLHHILAIAMDAAILTTTIIGYSYLHGVAYEKLEHNVKNESYMINATVNTNSITSHSRHIISSHHITYHVTMISTYNLLCRYLGTSRTDRYLFIVLEYVTGGSISGMIAQFGAFSEKLVRYVCMHACACILMYACMYLSMYSMYVYVYMYVCLHLSMYQCMM